MITKAHREALEKAEQRADQEKIRERRVVVSNLRQF